jgi:endoglucanase
MNINIPPKALPRRTVRRSFVSAFVTATALALATPASAAEWFLDKNQPQYSSWNTLADWKPAADGSGTSPSSLSSTDTYRTNNYALRTPETNTTTTFPGGTLWLDGGNGFLLVKTYSATGLAVIPKLVSTGGKIQNTSGGLQYVQVGTYENRSGSTTLTASSGRSLKLTVGTLVGSGELRMAGTGAGFLLDLANATTYTGDVYLASGTLNFDNDLSSAGRLRIDTGALVNLDQSVTFTGLVVAGTEYPVGTYSYATLQAAHPAIFTAGTSGGAIVVRAPRNWYLSTNQPVGASWNTLAHWRANPDGTGATADSVNAHDNYVNQVSGRNLRTPEVTATFGGGSLVLASGGNLVLKAQSGRSSTIPAFATSGAASISNGFNGITQPLYIDDWQADTGTTQLNLSNGTILSLNVKRLAGPGNITLGIGQTRPYIDHASEFTGTLTVNSGASLVLQTTLGTAGPLVVNSGGSVTLNAWAYVTGLTVNGVVKPAGIHTASSLGFSGTGSIVVYNAPLAASPQMFGVNLAGAEFSGTAFWQTNPAVWDYYQAKGLTLIRMPVKWERIQPALFGPVTFTQLDQCIALASARGMKVIIDLHNYAAYGSGSPTPRLGSTDLPISALVNVWTQIADRYKNNNAVYGYDLMNEPVSITIEVWSSAAQQTVDAIRQIDTARFVLVEGLGWSNAKSWRIGSTNGTLDIKDPVGRLIYSAHSYWDYKDNIYASPPYYGSDGVYRSDDVPNPQIGIDHIKPFVEWLKTRPYAYGNIGEYAVPNNYYQAGWNEAMGNFLQFVRDNNMGATYWAAGNNWVTSPTVCHPQPFPGTDKPQMSVLQLFNNN